MDDRRLRPPGDRGRRAGRAGPPRRSTCTSWPQPEPVSRDQAAAGVGRAAAHGEVPPRQAGRRGAAGDRVPPAVRAAAAPAPGGRRSSTGAPRARSRSPCRSAATTWPGRLLAAAIEDVLARRDARARRAAERARSRSAPAGRRGPAPRRATRSRRRRRSRGLRRARRARVRAARSSTGRSPCRTARSTRWPRSTRTWCAA